MRSFIAIDVPEDVVSVLRQIQQKIPGKLRLVRQFHLTLKFLSEISPDKVKRAKHLLGGITFEKFAVETANIGVFPSQSYISVVWVGIVPEEPLLRLKQEIDNALSREFRIEKNFTAHITLARVKYVDDRKEFLRRLNDIKLEKKKLTIENFKLKKSVLTGEGPVYEDISIFPAMS